MNWALFLNFLYMLLVVCLLILHSVLTIKFIPRTSLGLKLRLFYNITGIIWVLIASYTLIVSRTSVSLQSIIAITVIALFVFFMWLTHLFFLFVSNKLRNYIVSKIIISENLFRRLNRFYYPLVFGPSFLGLILLVNTMAPLVMKG